MAGDLVRHLARVREDPGLVQGEERPVAHHEPPVDHHGAHVVAADRVDEVRVRIEHRRQVRTLQVDEDQVGP